MVQLLTSLFRKHDQRARAKAFNAFALMAVLTLTSCANLSASRNGSTKPFVPSAVASAVLLEPQFSSEAHKVGAWSNVFAWPGVAIHAALLPSGKVLTFSTASGDQRSVISDPESSVSPHNTTQYVIWNPSQNRFETSSGSSVEMFCAGQTFDTDGNLIVVGGHGGMRKGGLLNQVELYAGIKAANQFNPATSSWSRLPDMKGTRWYPSAITLGTGEILVLGGTHNNTMDSSAINPEVWNGTNWRELTEAGPNPSMTQTAPDLLLGSVWSGEVEYPKIHLMPDGRVFWNGGGAKYAHLETAGAGGWTDVRNRSSVDALEHFNGASVMYRPGEILTAGGGEVNGPSNNSAYRINSDGSTLELSKLPNLHFKRSYLNSTVLADGGVAVTDGTSGGGTDKKFNTPFGVHALELWNPKHPDSWLLGPSASVTRGYHGVALLLPDARVLTAGGGACGSCGGQNNNAELYYPPYLFKKDGSGQLAARPVIANAPAQVKYGEAFTIKLKQPVSVSRVTLVRLGAVTHTFNMNQRFLAPAWSYGPSAPADPLETVVVNAPTNPNAAPPGHYLLFVFDGQGVPSIAKIVQIR